MKRRSLLGLAGAASAAAIASPALAQSTPVIRWRLTSSFPESLDTIYGGAVVMAKHVAEVTDNKFQIQVFASGQLVPGLQALDAASDGTVEMCHTMSYYYVGKDPTFAFFAAVPFGLNARQQHSWWYQGDGKALGGEFFKKYNVLGIPCGNSGTQMGGWFRKEVKTVADISGIKMRIGGITGQVLSKLGLVPQQIAGGDIYPALEKGTIDAVEWIGPYDDEKLGFNQIAKYYYYPGFWEGGAMIHSFINLKAWESLPKKYQTCLEDACAYANMNMMALYDKQNPQALKRLISSGTQLKRFSNEILDASLKATNELWAEISAKNEDFKKVAESTNAYRGDEFMWWQVSEYAFDDYMVRARGRNFK